MSYCTHALSYKIPFELGLEKFRPAARVLAEGMMWLGGGVLFAATVFVMVALPGFIE